MCDVIHEIVTSVISGGVAAAAKRRWGRRIWDFAQGAGHDGAQANLGRVHVVDGVIPHVEGLERTDTDPLHGALSVEDAMGKLKKISQTSA